jgi:death on curing protein
MLDEEIAFLTVDQVVRLHAENIRRFSPTESLAIRDQGLLESAVVTHQASWSGTYLYTTLVEMAAAYIIGLNQNHAFENGNKRVAFAACSTFLRMNGFRLTLSQQEAVELTLAIASHAIEREEVVTRIEAAVEAL